MLQPITDPNQWNNFVLALSPNTFLQSWEWGQVQKEDGEDVQYVGYFVDSALVGVALVITVHARRGRHYLIPHGPLVQDKHQLKPLLEELVTYLRQANHESVAVRIAPLTIKNDEAIKLFHDLGFRPAPMHVHAELTWVLDINVPASQVLQGMRKTTRHAVARAQKANVTADIVTEPQEALRRFWPLYEQTRARHGFVLWSQPIIEQQLTMFGQNDRIFTVIAQHDGHDVAAAIIIHFGTTAFYYHGASMKLPSSIPAAQYLQWQAIQEAQRRGARHYNFWGIAPDNQPHHPFAGITTFKKGFGGHALEYLHAQDLPLSVGYWKLWAVDMYRRYRRGF